MSKISILGKLTPEVLAKIKAQSSEHITTLQKSRKKGSGRRKPQLDTVTDKYYANGQGKSVVVISPELKKAIAIERVESGKTEKQIVAEALIQYLGLD
jgi:hypothetical protein